MEYISNEKYIDLFNNYNLTFNNTIATSQIISNNNETIQTGIGDILLIFLLIANDLIQTPVYFNINIYTSNLWKINNPLTDLKFKLDLINKLNNNSNTIIFYNDTDIQYTNKWQVKFKNITNRNLLQKYFDLNNPYKEEYIVFHTKCRFYSDFNYSKLKQQLRTFYQTFKTNYKIIIMGERIMPNNFESKEHNITTIYEELLELKNNNEIIDLTSENIYDNLNFDNYIKDMAIIHNAKTNILVGCGGQFCNSIIFGKDLICYSNPILIENLNINHIHFDIHFEFNNFLNKLIQYSSNIMDKVSVVIPTYNRFKYLLNAISSVKNQTYQNIEIIVVNDRSTEQEYYEYDFESNGVKIIHLEQNSKTIFGFACPGGYQRNFGMKIATGKYIAFLDDDDIWFPNKLDLQIKAMNETGYEMSCTDGLVGCGQYNPNNKYPKILAEKHFDYLQNMYQEHGYERRFPKIWDLKYLKIRNCCICSSVILTKDVCNKVGNFINANTAEDYEYWLRVLEYTNCVYVDDVCMYYDEGHGDGQNYSS